MTLGEPKKVIVLALVALTIITVAVFRSIPKGSSGKPSEAATNEGTSASSTATDLLGSVFRDAFAHPQLPRSEEAAAEAEAEPPPGEALPGSALPRGIDISSASAMGTPTLPLAVQPEETTSSNQKSEEAPKREIEVKAIIAVTKPLAVISIDGVDKTFVRGDRFLDDGLVVSISEHVVLIKLGAKQRSLSVGDKWEL